PRRRIRGAGLPAAARPPGVVGRCAGGRGRARRGRLRGAGRGTPEHLALPAGGVVESGVQHARGRHRRGRGRPAGGMKYQVLAEAYTAIERTTSRLQMTARLADLFRATQKADIARVVYLTQGKLYPDFEGIEIGVAEKSAVRAVAQATGVREEVVARRLGREGDLGTVAEALLANRAPTRPVLTIDQVHEALDRAARASGSGAQTTRLAAIADLLKR